MKAYIGNKTVCLAQPEDRESQAGYDVLWPDGGETWLTKEIFEFEYRKLESVEVQMVVSTIIDTDLSEDQLKTIIDWDDLSKEDQDVLELNMETNPDNYEVVENEVAVLDVIESFEEEVTDAK